MSFPGVVDQHHIGFTMAADDGQLFPVCGIAEIADEFRLEVGELLARSALQVLQPEIVRSAVANRVDNAGAVVPEDNRIIPEERSVFGWRLLKIKEPGGLAEIERRQRQLLLRFPRGLGDDDG